MRLRNKRGKYYARLRVWNGIKEKDSLIPLKTRLKTDAIRRFKVVQSHENDLKSGIIQKFQYEDYFEWMNEEGASILIKRRLNDVIPDYLAYRQTKKRHGTVNRDRISLNQLTNFLGNKAIDELSYEDIEGTDGLIPYLQRNGYKNTGINISLRHIKTFFGWLYSKKRMIPEPIKFEMIDLGEQLYCYFSESELQGIYDYDGINDMFKRFFYFYEQTGVRAIEPFIGELLGDWLMVDSDKSKGKNVREIHLTEELKTILEEMQSFRNSYKEMGSKRPNEAAYERISKMLAKAVKGLNFQGKKLTIKSFRHTYGIRRVFVTGNIFQVAMEMGHKNVTTTQHYLRFKQRRLTDFPSLNEYIEKGEKQTKHAVRGTQIRGTHLFQTAVS